MDSNSNNGWGNEQKVKSTSCFVKGIATGITIMLAAFVIILVANIILTKDYIETDDREEMLHNGGFDSNGNTIPDDKDDDNKVSYDIPDELAEIFEKAGDIQDIIEKYYYYDEDMDKLADGIYSGMMDSLGDPYSVYYNEEAFKSMMESTSGTYCGIGVVVQQDANTKVITVVNPYEGCPGYEAGIQPGDIVLGADDVDFTNMDINEADSYIRGEEGTKVTIHVKRGEEALDFVLTRKTIEVPTVSYECVEGNIAHISIDSFDEVTYDQFNDAMKQAEKDGCEGYIFDVRDNGGGLYDTVVDMLDDLLPKGKIVYTEDKYGNQQTEYSDEACLDAPIAVLINGNSASASEIFAGAIQDYGVGKLFGTTSFGKGIVQSIIPLYDGTAVKVTISSYFTPNGRNIHGTGISPDVVVELPQEEEAYENGFLKEEYDTQLKEAVKYIQSELQ